MLGFFPVLERLVFSGSKSLYWRNFLLFALKKNVGRDKEDFDLEEGGLLSDRVYMRSVSIFKEGTVKKTSFSVLFEKTSFQKSMSGENPNLSIFL